MTRGLRTACQKRTSQSWRCSRETSFGPNFSNRSQATVSVNPSEDVSKSRKASAVSIRAASARRDGMRAADALRLGCGVAGGAAGAGAVAGFFDINHALIYALRGRRQKSRCRKQFKCAREYRQANPKFFFSMDLTDKESF